VKHERLIPTQFCHVHAHALHLTLPHAHAHKSLTPVLLLLLLLLLLESPTAHPPTTHRPYKWQLSD
jgi:hypothetical protein